MSAVNCMLTVSINHSRAIFHIMGTGLFWFLLLIIVVTAMVPHFVFKAFTEHFRPSDIQIAREMEKFANVNQVNRLEFPTRELS
jgi:phospholipid-transporting ATPase